MEQQKTEARPFRALIPVIAWLLFASGPAGAQVLNPSFESGYLNWTTSGAVSVEGSSPGFTCTDGAACSFSTTCDPVEGVPCGTPASPPASTTAIESVCGFSAGLLAGMGLTEGSVIAQSFSTTTTNQRILFDFNLLSDEPKGTPLPDLVFTGVNGELTQVADAVGASWSPSATLFAYETGYQLQEFCVFDAAQIDFCVGVADSTNTLVPSGLLLDDLQLTAGGGGGCPGWTRAHDDTLSYVTQEDTVLDIAESAVLANDADSSSTIVSVSNAVCGGVPASVLLGSGTISLTPPADFPPSLPSDNACSFDYTIEGPTSPHDATPVQSTATVSGITVLQGEPCGPSCLEADIPYLDVASNSLDTIEDVPVALQVTAYSTDDDGSEFVALYVTLSEGSLVAFDGMPLLGTVCAVGACSPPHDGLSLWVVFEESDIPLLHYLNVPNRANRFMDGTCGPESAPCSSTGQDIFIDVEATAQEIGLPFTENTVSWPESISVRVREDPDAPEVTATDPAIGTEDGSIALALSASSFDQDLSEVMTIKLTGVPTWATLNNGTDVGGGIWDLNPGILGSLEISVIGSPDHRDDNISLTLEATSSEIFSNLYGAYDSGSETPQATAQVPFVVEINGVADAPSLSLVSSVQTDEDTPVVLTINSSLIDTDGSEDLTVEISNIPVGAELLPWGVVIHEGTLSFAPDDLPGLMLTPSLHDDTDLALTVTARATETTGQCDSSPGGGGHECSGHGDCGGGTCIFSTATTTGSIDVAVDAVADVPDLATEDASGLVNTTIGLEISSSVVDTDGSESLSVELSGVQGTLNKGTDNGGGQWTLTFEDLLGLNLTPPMGMTGDIVMTVTAIATESNAENGVALLTASTADTLTVSVIPASDVPALSVWGIALVAGLLAGIGRRALTA